MMSTKIHVRHILTQARYEAEDVLRLLGQGKKFEELALKCSICSSKDQGGDLGPVSVQRLDPDFAEAAMALKAGEVSSVVRSRFGYHIIQRIQ